MSVRSAARPPRQSTCRTHVAWPDIDGYELARTLRAEHRRTPLLIAATGYGRAVDRQRAHEAGYDCHFVKPVSVRDIVHALDEHIHAPA